MSGHRLAVVKLAGLGVRSLDRVSPFCLYETRIALFHSQCPVRFPSRRSHSVKVVATKRCLESRQTFDISRRVPHGVFEE
jgi:hypothetical protein